MLRNVVFWRWRGVGGNPDGNIRRGMKKPGKQRKKKNWEWQYHNQGAKIEV